MKYDKLCISISFDIGCEAFMVVTVHIVLCWILTFCSLEGGRNVLSPFSGLNCLWRGISLVI
jgi:low affinity Fe/Cu permease